jgi:hypothetical protein
LLLFFVNIGHYFFINIFGINILEPSSSTSVARRGTARAQQSRQRASLGAPVASHDGLDKPASCGGVRDGGEVALLQA